jgi:hypothetical protein
MTPTAPRSHARASSSTAASGYSHGSEQSHRMREGYAVWAAAMSSLTICAAFRLTSRPPQYTLGHVSEMIARSTPAASICRIRYG